MRFLKPVLIPSLFALGVMLAPPAAAGTSTFGPVHLRTGQHFEVCASARSSVSVSVAVSFRRASNASVLRSAERTLAPGEGRCLSVDFSEVGEAPIFAILQTDGALNQTDYLAASACIINGIFACPTPVAVVQVEQGGEQTEVSNFGPIRLKPDSRLEVCANNAFNSDSTDVTVKFYRGRDSSEPFATKSGALLPGRGSCASVNYDRVGDVPIFAEITAVARGVSGPAVTIVRSAAVINGVIPYIPDERRLTAVL